MQPVVRYVQNDKAPVGKYSVADYDSYVQSVHEEYTGSYPDWSGWDHWLDQV